MRVIVRLTVTVRRARLSLLPAALLVAGCGTAPVPAPPAELSGIGMVRLREATAFAVEPGGKPISRPRSNLGLVLERRDGKSRVLAADGSQGWTGASLMPVAGAVTVECMGDNFSLFAESPDVVSPEAGETRRAAAREGALLGAAKKAYPASQQQLLAPERLRVMLPVMRVACGVEGYAPLDWLWLKYTAPPLGEITGLAQRPFLGPFRKALEEMAPKASSEALVFLEDRLERRPLAEGFRELHGFYRDPGGSGKTLTVYGNGAGRLLRFSQPEVSLLMPEYAPYVLRVEVQEAVWLVEVVSIFGDGAYSTLFRIGASGEVTFRPLSRSSGEEAEDAEAAWGWLSGKEWTARRVKGKVSLTGFPHLWLAEVDDPLEVGATQLPRAEGGWITAVPSATEEAAKGIAKGRNVRRYP